MDQADHQQPEDATIINSTYFRPALLGPLVHQHQPCAEEHGEDRHHLAFEDHVIEEPDAAIEPLEAAATERIGIRDSRPAKTDDIHCQNAQKRKAPEHVNGEESLSRRNRLGAVVDPKLSLRQRCPGFCRLRTIARFTVQHSRFSIRLPGMHIEATSSNHP